MSITYSEIMEKIPNTIFNDVAVKYPVDNQNHKLTGKNLFGILLYNICTEDQISLRIIESSFGQEKLNIEHKGKLLKASKSGISDRLKNIDYRYYETIFLELRKIFEKEIQCDEKNHPKLFDSTTITLSSKLFHSGFKVSNGDKNQIKLSIGFDLIPSNVTFGENKSDTSENIALKKAIKQASLSKDDIIVFDRGLNGRKNFEELDESQIKFVTRLNNKTIFKTLETYDPDIACDTETLEITSDSKVLLHSKDIHWIKTPFRLIQAISKKTGKTINFLTNIFDLSSEEITEIYKKRWDIEIFFKFIKQYLNAKHFLSRNLNGIKVTFYMILIAAMLILTFKKLNFIESFKFAKRKFIDQLKNALTYEIIWLYRDYPSRFKRKAPF